MAEPECDICHQALDDYGAIVLGPPVGKKVEKHHVCKDCYETWMEGLFSLGGSHLGEPFE